MIVITTEEQKNSILSDKFFKFIFLKEESKPLLKMFLKEILKECMKEDISDINIKDIDIRNSELALELSTEKGKRVDLLIFYENYAFNLEASNHIEDRNIQIVKNTLYAFSIGVRLTKEGDIYRKPKKVIQVNFFNYPVSKELKDRPISIFNLLDQSSLYPLNDILTIVYINVALCKEMCYNDDSVKDSIKVFASLGAESPEEIAKILKTEDGRYDKEVKMFSDYFEEYKNSNVCINPYDQEKLAREEREYFAEEARKKGLREGIEQGIEQGIEKGIEQGKQEGLREGIEQGKQAEAVKTIKAMLKEGLDEKIISKITGHTVAEINNLK